MGLIKALEYNDRVYILIPYCLLERNLSFRVCGEKLDNLWGYDCYRDSSAELSPLLEIALQTNSDMIEHNYRYTKVFQKDFNLSRFKKIVQRIESQYEIPVVKQLV